jgi:hypothetical protein
MRAIIALLLSSVAACAADKTADTSKDTHAAPTIAPIESAPPPPVVDPQQYVGRRSSDWLLEAPEPLRPRGERILADESDLGLVVLSIDGGGELIFLDRRTEEGDFIIEAVLELPVHVGSKQVAWEHCLFEGKADPRIVAVAADNRGCEPAPVSAAWRVDLDAAVFESISPAEVRCLAPDCEHVELPGGVPGGVVGGVVGGGAN